MRFSERLVEEVRQRNDLVEVIATYVPLKRAGRHYKARCPFHQEKTPSFLVHPEKQVYHCFGCGAGGNVYTFLMQHERMSFTEAVAFLAKRAGVALPREGSERGEASESLYAVNAFAASFFQRNLKGSQGGPARAYLERRGIGSETIATFGLGYALPSWDSLLKAASAEKQNLRNLEKAGLVVARESGGGFYDRFRNRLMFPILSLSGKVVGFGGRRLNDQDEPKYLNSPDTAIYQKGRLLFGLAQTKGAIQDSGIAVVVEGYLDLLTPFQAGVRNLVATLGTAFTADQARLLARFATTAILFYDNDEAGRVAAQRALDPLAEVDLDVFIAAPPEGMDPDALARKEGREGLERALTEKRDWVDYELERLTETRDLKSPGEKARAVSVVLEILAKFHDEIRQRAYLQKLAQRTALAEEVLLRGLMKRPRGGIPERISPAKTKKEAMLERELLRLSAMNPERMDLVRSQLEGTLFQDPLAQEVHAALVQGKASGDAADWMTHLASEESQRWVASWAFLSPEDTEERRFLKCLEELKGLRRKERSQALLRALAKAEQTKDQAAAEALTSEYQGLLRRNRKA